jgi:hypothetical protein
MKLRRVLVMLMAAAVLALAAAAPTAAQSFSCVGWFASTLARDDGQGFGAEISALAHEARPFGWTTVAPFAHLPLEFCQSED